MDKNTDFRERKQKIKDMVKRIDQEDENWKWSVKRITKERLELHWEYLNYLGEETPFFTIRYDDDLQMYAAYDQDDWFMNYELEETGSLEGIMRSVAYYAHSRY